jgi:hypothetical protein
VRPPGGHFRLGTPPQVSTRLIHSIGGKADDIEAVIIGGGGVTPSIWCCDRLLTVGPPFKRGPSEEALCLTQGGRLLDLVGELLYSLLLAPQQGRGVTVGFNDWRHEGAPRLETTQFAHGGVSGAP